MKTCARPAPWLLTLLLLASAGCSPTGEVCDDADSDGVCDTEDVCPGFDDTIDGDGDGVADGCDLCPADSLDDSDADGSCDGDDLCPGFDDTLDADGDEVADGCDACPADALDDSDGDGVCDSVDVCNGFDDATDADGDEVADGCDACPDDALDDSDGDGVCDSVDVCDGFDDTLDADGDGVPDGCDLCPGFDDLPDTDQDTVPDCVDNCPLVANPGQDDTDGDGTGDLCTDDIDGDGVTNDVDNCVTVENLSQQDSDAVSLTYSHPANSGLSDSDCFEGGTEICLTRDITGPLINTGSVTVEWACGPCTNTTGTWVPLVTDLRASCFGGQVPNIVDTPVCLRAPGWGAWDFDFSSYQGGGGGGFAYTRVREDGVGDACDVCWAEYDPGQEDSDGNCAAAPYTSDPVCGDACQL